MSYNNPAILSIQAPTGLDIVVESLRLALDNNLLWLDKSFGRAWEFKEILPSGKEIRVPKTYTGEGGYYPVLPNDFFISQSFIAARGAEEWSQFNRFEGSIKNRKLSIIFWFNLKEIDPSKDYIFTEELKSQVEDILKRHPSVLSLDSYYDEKAEDVFNPYDLGNPDYCKSEYLMYPYSGFRFDLTAQYDEQCQSSTDINFNYPNRNKNDIEFYVGDAGYDLEGQTLFQDDSLKGYKVRVFRNSVKQSKLVSPGGYSFIQSAQDIVDGKFSVTPAFSDQELISIEKY